MARSSEKSTNGEKVLLQQILWWVIGQTVLVLTGLITFGAYTLMELSSHDAKIEALQQTTSWLVNRP